MVWEDAEPLDPFRSRLEALTLLSRMGLALASRRRDTVIRELHGLIRGSHEGSREV